jgi:hypothetical protein
MTQQNPGVEFRVAGGRREAIKVPTSSAQDLPQPLIQLVPSALESTEAEPATGANFAQLSTCGLPLAQAGFEPATSRL